MQNNDLIEIYLLNEDSPFFFKIVNYVKPYKGLYGSQKIALFVGHIDYKEDLLLSGHGNHHEAIQAMNKEGRKFNNGNGPHWQLYFEPNTVVSKSNHPERKIPIHMLLANQKHKI